MQYPTEIRLKLNCFAGFKEQKLTVIYSIQNNEINPVTFYSYEGVGAEGLGEGWVVEMSQLKIMPIISCFKRLSICISIPFHRFGVFIHSIGRKKCNCNLYFPKY